MFTFQISQLRRQLVSMGQTRSMVRKYLKLRQMYYNVCVCVYAAIDK